MRSRFVLALLVIVVLFAVSFAGEKPKFDLTKSGVAIRGYDPVAYFAEAKPVKGSEKFTYLWMDATWHFSKEENRVAFQNGPEAYAPAFGGYCAYAVSRNYTWTGDPLVWKIVDGKLYLNANAEAQKAWEEDVPGNIKEGNKNWPGVLKK